MLEYLNSAVCGNLKKYFMQKKSLALEHPHCIILYTNVLVLVTSFFFSTVH